MEVRNSRKRFCSTTCRTSAHKAGGVPVVTVPFRSERAESAGAVTKSVRTELAAAGREDSALGAAALLIAARIDANAEPGAAMAALLRELRATMAEALRTSSTSVVAGMRDELAERRARA